MEKIKDVGQLCIDCKEDTSFGSGKFVNRIPADDGKVSGFMCADCQMVECDSCKQKVFEYETSEQGMWWCIDKCYKPETLIDIKTKFRDAQGMFENLLETYPDDKDINLFSRKLNELFKLMGENNETLAD
tara:strand:- start:166 stop:555 length:390 start_codon:yes stop_codon:yes gene_type:complete